MNKILHITCLLIIHLSLTVSAQQYRFINNEHIGDTTVISANGQKETFTYVELLPEPEYDVVAFIKNNINCPPRTDTILHKEVTVKFQVKADGNIDSVHVAHPYWKRINPALKKEAIRVISMMPPWQPGKQSDKPVAMWYMLLVNFDEPNCY